MHGISLCRKQLGRSTGWLRPAAGGAGRGARDCMRSGARELDQLARSRRTAYAAPEGGLPGCAQLGPGAPGHLPGRP